MLSRSLSGKFDTFVRVSNFPESERESINKSISAVSHYFRTLTADYFSALTLKILCRHTTSMVYIEYDVG